MLVDVFSQRRARQGSGRSARRACITVNKNAIPFDLNPPFNPSGIRLGSPAVTTRGFGEPEMQLVAEMIAEILANHESADTIAAVRKRVEALTARFPLYEWKLAPTAAAR